MKMRRVEKEAGIILITTLLAMFFLLMLTGAFVSANMNNLRLSTQVEVQERAVQAAMAGIQYAQTRLEADTTWGVFVTTPGPPKYSGYNGELADPATVQTVTTPIINVAGLIVYENRTTVNQAITPVSGGPSVQLTPGEARGWINGGQASFRFRFNSFAAGTWNDPNTSDVESFLYSYNNLDETKSSVTYISGISGLDRQIPTGSCYLVVMGESGGGVSGTGDQRVARTVEVILKRTALVDASAVAYGDLVIGLGGATPDRFYMNSTSPFDNKVRAGALFKGLHNDAWGGRIIAPQVDTTNSPPDYANTVKTTFWDRFPTDPLTSDRKGNAIAKKDIIFGASLLAAGTGKGDASIAGGTTLDGTDKTLLNKANQAVSGVLFPNSGEEYDIPDVDKSKIKITGALYGLDAGTYEFTESDKVKFTPVAGAVKNYNNKIQVNKISGTGANKKDIVLKDFQFRVPRDANLEVDGDFTLQRSPLLTTGRPKLAFAYDDKGPQSLSGGQSTPTLKVVGGDVTVKGGVDGTGTMIVGESAGAGGNLEIQGRSQLATNPSKGVAIYTDKDVTLLTVDALSDADIGSTAEFAAFKDAMSNNWSTNIGTTGKNMNEWDDMSDNNKDNAANVLSNKSIGSVVADPLSASGWSVTITSSGQKIQIDAATLGNLWPTPMGGEPVNLENLVRVVKAKKDPDYGNPTKKSSSDVQDKIKEYVDGYYDDRGSLEDQIEGSWWGGGKDKVKVALEEFMTGSPYPQGTKGMNAIEYAKFTSFWNTYYPTYAPAATTDPQDMEFIGLLYSKGKVSANPGGHKFYIEGALVAAGGDVAVTDAKEVRFVYNPSYLRLLQTTGTLTKMEQAFWALW